MQRMRNLVGGDGEALKLFDPRGQIKKFRTLQMVGHTSTPSA